MSKKYMVDIPDNGLSKEQIIELGKSGKSINWIVKNIGRILPSNLIIGMPDFLLKEIKQPVTAEEWVYENYGEDLDRMALSGFAIVKGFLAGEENERLKHEQKCGHEWQRLNEFGTNIRTVKHRCKKCGMEVPF